MFRYLVRRLVLMVPTLLGAITLIFVILRVLPGDVATLMAGGDAAGQVSEERVAAIRHEAGLDRPLLVQYRDWLSAAFRMDFGKSLWSGYSVRHELGRRYQVTAALAVLAFLVSLAIAIPTGVLAALKQDTWVDYAVRAFAIGGISVPSFWLALLVLLALVHYLGWTPPISLSPPWRDPWLSLRQLGVPALVVGYHLSALVARMTRSCMLEVLREDFVRTAWAKGLSGWAVATRHALRNAMLPVVTLLGVEVLVLLGGIVLVETVFTVPGIGRYLVDSITYRDYNAVQAIIWVFTLFVLVVNLVTDLAYRYLDPRVRYS
ncbi:MAG: ABC transporter permease [Chloroflexi bacterium]|nr:ABC transporter permease [Chloroflexota bacterium]